MGPPTDDGWGARFASRPAQRRRLQLRSRLAVAAHQSQQQQRHTNQLKDTACFLIFHSSPWRYAYLSSRRTCVHPALIALWRQYHSYTTRGSLPCRLPRAARVPSSARLHYTLPPRGRPLLDLGLPYTYRLADQRLDMTIQEQYMQTPGMPISVGEVIGAAAEGVAHQPYGGGITATPFGQGAGREATCRSPYCPKATERRRCRGTSSSSSRYFPRPNWRRCCAGHWPTPGWPGCCLTHCCPHTRHCMGNRSMRGCTHRARALAE